MDQVQQMRSRGGADANALSVRLELQADCYAGLWAHHAERAKPILESGDVEEALGAASAIGDDRLQRQTQGTVVPESFTHGTSGSASSGSSAVFSREARRPATRSAAVADRLAARS